MRAAIARPVPGSSDDPSALAWLFLVLIFAGLAVVPVAVERAPSAGSGIRRLAADLGFGVSKRARQLEGAVPRPVFAAAAANEAAEQAADTTEPEAEEAASPSAPPRAVPLAFQAGERARVANTDNLGVVLHTAPRPEARVPRGLLEGARVVLLDYAGSEWARVRAEDGLDGWVPTRYLAAAD